MKHNFKNLEIWKRSRTLVKDIYQLTNGFAKEEKFGLIGQMRRAAISITSNIAEGCGRRSEKELIQFLSVSVGSLCELETQLYLATDLKFTSIHFIQSHLDEINEIRSMIRGFSNKLSQS
jgi:four helix bundle protein